LTKEGVIRVLGNSQKAVFWTIIVGFENLLDCCVPNSSAYQKDIIDKTNNIVTI